MNKIPSNDDDINLFDFFYVLYKGKLLISLFVLISLSSGLIYYVIKEHVYMSKLRYEVSNPPPLINLKLVNEFNSYFFSKKMFETWKNSNSKKSFIKYEDFVHTKFLDGFIFQKHKKDRVVEFSKDKVGRFIKIKSRNLSMLNNFFEYISFINRNLTTKYISRAEEELIITKNLIKEFSSNDFNNQSQINSLQRLMTLNSYLTKAKTGSSVLTIHRPSIPIKISPPSLLTIIALFFVIGVVVGSFFLLILESFRKYKRVKI